MLRPTRISVTTTLGLGCAWAAVTPAPNIIYIVSDDLGWKDTGFQGAQDLRTPNLDRLASEGTRLTQFYVQPMCTPTRAALLTGRYPLRYGLQTMVIPSTATYGLATDERLLPQILKDAGYRTAMVGKWHLGHAQQAFWPRQRGFDSHYGAVIGEIDYFTREAHGVLDWQRDNQPVRESGYVTQLMGAEAVRRIEQHDQRQPLFLYLAFTAPHAPYQAPQDYLDRFNHISEPTRRAYAAMIACMDDEIGRVTGALDRSGMRKNTLIVWHSDNGGTKSKMFAGEGDVSKITIPCDNGTLKGGKGQVYEGGTRVPCLINWPGHIAAGVSRDGLVHITDMLPTLAGLAVANITGTKPLDGHNAWPHIATGVPSMRSEMVYNVDPLGGAIRQDNWKLVWKATLPTLSELYDLANDPDETRNLAAAEPARVQALQARLEHYARESAQPHFFSTSLQVLMGGLFGRADIPYSTGIADP
jgi:arylsulfatase A-like enzyme